MMDHNSKSPTSLAIIVVPKNRARQVAQISAINWRHPLTSDFLKNSKLFDLVLCTSFNDGP